MARRVAHVLPNQGSLLKYQRGQVHFSQMNAGRRGPLAYGRNAAVPLVRLSPHFWRPICPTAGRLGHQNRPVALAPHQTKLRPPAPSASSTTSALRWRARLARSADSIKTGVCHRKSPAASFAVPSIVSSSGLRTASCGQAFQHPSSGDHAGYQQDSAATYRCAARHPRATGQPLS